MTMKSEIVRQERKELTDHDDVDFLSMLPDDIIVSILSRLTIAEAARTSVLCVRWRYLWTYHIGSLDFDGSHVLHELEQRRTNFQVDDQKLIHEEREKFRRRVDQVLKSLRTQTVESLRIHFDLGNDSHVDNWVQFAIQKKVKKLDLDLVNSMARRGYEYCVVPSLLKLPSLPSLQVLRLSSVDVSGEDLEYLLSSCPFLETLAVSSSKNIVSFKVCSHSKLKQLDIAWCFNLETLEISAESLVSFTCYSGRRVPSINYKHIPNVKEVCFGGVVGDVVFNNFFHLTTYDHSSYLKVLKLTIFAQPRIQLPQNLVLATLHHLELFFGSMEEMEYNLCVSLMNRCYSLRSLTLKMLFHRSHESPQFGIKEAHAYDWVEEVKVVGFSGSSAEVEFIEYVIKNSKNLKKLFIDPILPIYLGLTFENKIRETEDYSLARTRARNMEPNIPPYVEFVIL